MHRRFALFGMDALLYKRLISRRSVGLEDFPQAFCINKEPETCALSLFPSSRAAAEYSSW